MNNIFDTYIPKFIVNLNRENEDIITVQTRYFSEEGDVFILDTRTVSPSVLQTVQSINELEPEVSTTYPFKVVTPVQEDGSTLIYTPSVNTEPTASQNYYAPIYFERINSQVIYNLEKEFTELTIGSSASPVEILFEELENA